MIGKINKILNNNIIYILHNNCCRSDISCGGGNIYNVNVLNGNGCPIDLLLYVYYYSLFLVSFIYDNGHGEYIISCVN